MEYTSINEAFQGKPYERGPAPILETHHANEKKKLLENFDSTKVYNVHSDRKIAKYESTLFVHDIIEFTSLLPNETQHAFGEDQDSCRNDA